VLAAGRGRRLEPLTLTCPKPLLPVAGRPILEHVLDTLTELGISDIVVVVGHLGDQIEAYLATRPEPKPRAVVQPVLAGNGDAVRAAADYLDGPVLVTFGDTIVRAAFGGPACRGDALWRGPSAGAVVVAHVADTTGYGLVEVDADGWVRRLWEKPAVPPSHDAVAGTFVFPEGRRLRRALDEVAEQRAAGRTSPPDEVWLTDVVQHMIDSGERFRPVRVDAFYDCGTPARLAEAERAFRGAEARRRAVFLDRDGVLVRDVDHLTSVSQLEILPGVPEALRRLHDAGWAVVVVTNQSVVARGWLTEDGLRDIHRELASRLAARGAVLDAIYYCPHHPDGAVAAYRLACDCRKPKPGLLLRAADDLDLDLGASVMVGDVPTDVEAGKRAGCRTVLIRGGRAAERDGAGPPADHVAADLADAADWILAPSRAVRSDG
jgi:D,D-heptose 1,7-bisphosphate phosphatase